MKLYLSENFLGISSLVLYQLPQKLWLAASSQIYRLWSWRHQKEVSFPRSPRRAGYRDAPNPWVLSSKMPSEVH